MRLTEDQITVLRPQYNEYPERIISAPGYPINRKKRGLKADEQAALHDTELGAMPAASQASGVRSEIWSIMLLKAAALTGAQRGSPPFTGPGLLHSFTGMMRHGDGSVTTDPFQLSYSESPIQNIDLNTTNQKLPGTRVGIPTYVDFASSPTFAVPDGFVGHYSLLNATATIPLGIYIPHKTFYLGVSMFARYAANTYWMGTFRVILNAPPESVGW